MVLSLPTGAYVSESGDSVETREANGPGGAEAGPIPAAAGSGGRLRLLEDFRAGTLGFGAGAKKRQERRNGRSSRAGEAEARALKAGRVVSGVRHNLCLRQ